MLHTKLIAALVTGLFVSGSASAGAIVSGFGSNTLPKNDDSSTGLVNIGFSINFFGTDYSQLYVNNNGNVTFDRPLSTYTPFGLNGTSTPIIAPFFADVDTRNYGSPVTYGTGTYDGRDAFGVNWVNVGQFNLGNGPLNSFQLILVDRSDIGAGEFDIIFNYDSIQWDTGTVSNVSAYAGWSNGNGDSHELDGSGITGAFFDNGAYALVSDKLNTNQDGSYSFFVRGGTPTPTPTPSSGVPEPSI
ncbi:MAG: VPLPA-CTERM sorting domain-containing protein, partial [Azoarcus sp.]|nr:VPLPA-CTERM sorting domain-containing protein [Azoarcus sp.]